VAALGEALVEQLVPAADGLAEQQAEWRARRRDGWIS
jgi:hypothetical protein